jgi:hypothetical protein
LEINPHFGMLSDLQVIHKDRFCPTVHPIIATNPGDDLEAESRSRQVYWSEQLVPRAELLKLLRTE